MTKYVHKVTLSQSDIFKNEWNQLLNTEKGVILLIKNNFIAPISQGWDPFSELIGKYKPSFNVRFADSIMKQKFIALAKKHNLYHYHFGYPVYIDGHDTEFDGAVSDGIIHTKIITDEKKKEIEHRIIQICKSHPNPFAIPFNRIDF